MFYETAESDLPHWWDVLDAENPSSELSSEPSAFPEASDDSDHVDHVDHVDYLDHSDRGETGSTVPTAKVSESAEAACLSGGRLYARGYEREVIENVWNFAEVVPGNDPDLWRKDEWGNWIRRIDYGKRESEFGWEIFDPGIGRHSQGVYAMRPMQWTRFLEQFETLG